jgi:Fe-S-cluster containining protein
MKLQETTTVSGETWGRPPRLGFSLGWHPSIETSAITNALRIVRNRSRLTGKVHRVHTATRAPYSLEMAEELDCLTCGACCRTGTDGRILIPPQDLTRWREIGRDDIAEAVQPGHFGMVAFATRQDGSCVHLGTSESSNACRIYEIRGTTCQEFEKGSRQCLEFRREASLG